MGLGADRIRGGWGCGWMGPWENRLWENRLWADGVRGGLGQGDGIRG